MSQETQSKALVYVIVPAAGIGSRFVPGSNKPFHTIGGRPMLYWVLRAFDQHPLVSEVIPAVKQQDMRAVLAMAKSYGLNKVTRAAIGGKERQDSVHNALKLIKSERKAIVMVHDAARPFISAEIINRVIDGLAGNDGCIAAVPAKDTIKQTNKAGIVARTPDRSTLWQVQTPQAFALSTLKRAYKEAMGEKFYSTDDSALVERMGAKVKVVMGSYDNIKLTTPEDITIAEEIMLRQRRSKP